MDYALAAAVGDRIRQLRQSENWTQDELARKIGVSRTVVGCYEAGTKMPSYTTLIRIADVFGTTTDYILRGGELQPMGAEELPDEQITALRTIVAALRQAVKE